MVGAVSAPPDLGHEARVAAQALRVREPAYITELVLDLDFLETHQRELEVMNQHKRGPHYRMANSYVQLLAAVRYLYGMPYRQLEGFTRALNRLVPQLPPGDYSGLRRRILRLDLSPYRHLKESDEPAAISVDSTGVRVHKAGGWVERIHGKRRRYVKLHFAVNTETREVVAMEVSTNDTHDAEAFPGLLGDAEKNVRVSRVYGDGSYDSGKVYGLLESRGIEAVIKPRRNARPDAGPPARRRTVELHRQLGHDAWARATGYGRRWMVETAYSAFKRLFGEHAQSRGPEGIARELTAKVALYDALVNT